MPQIDLRFVAVLSLATALNLAPCAAAPFQESQTKKDAEAQNPLSALQQLGDDATPELNDAIESPDKKKAESLAAYMDGLAHQKKGNLTEAQKAFRTATEADPTAPEPVRAHAVLLMRLGRVRQAEEMARKAVELDPADFDTRLQLAELLRARGNVREAIRLIEEALTSERLDKQSADFIRIHTVRGILFGEADVAHKAAESYEVLLNALERPEDFGLDFREHQALMKNRLTGYEGIGKVMLRIGKNDLAMTAFSALVRINQDVPGDHHFLLALAQYRKDLLDDAEQNLKTYFRTNRRTRGSLQLLTDIYGATNRTSGIPEQLRKLVDGSSDATTVQLFLGEFLIDQGDGIAAEEVFQRIITDSGDPEAYVGLIRVDILNRNARSLSDRVTRAFRARVEVAELIPLKATIVNDVDFAREVVATCIESLNSPNEKNPAETFFYSQIAEELELAKEEEQLLRATLDLNPGARLGIEVLGRLGFNLLLQEKFAESAGIYRQLLSVPGLPGQQRIISLYRLSQAESYSDNHDGAIAAIETALKLSPQNSELTYQLGWAQLRAEQYEESEKSLQAAIALSEKDPGLKGRAGLMLGALFTQLGRWGDAIAAYEAILAVPDLDAEMTRRARVTLSNAYVQSGDITNGERILEEVYATAPEDPGVNNDLGYLYAEQNKNLDQAEKMIRLAVEAEPNNAAYLDSLGWVLFRLKRNDEALKVLQKANSDPDYQDATIIEHLGDVQNALGKLEDAKKTWQQAIDVERKSASPDDKIIKRLEEKLNAIKTEDPNR